MARSRAVLSTMGPVSRLSRNPVRASTHVPSGQRRCFVHTERNPHPKAPALMPGMAERHARLLLPTRRGRLRHQVGGSGRVNGAAPQDPAGAVGAGCPPATHVVTVTAAAVTMLPAAGLG